MVDKGFTHAAAIAYYAIVSLFPLLLLIISAAGFILKGDFQQQVLSLGSRYLPGNSLGFVRENISAVIDSRGSLTILGVVGLVWSASLMFDAINEAVNAAWGVTHPERFLVSKLKSITMVFLLLLFVLGSVAFTTQAALFDRFGSLFLRNPPGQWIWNFGHYALSLLGYVSSMALTVTAFVLTYLYLPRYPVRLQEVVLGAALAGITWEVSKQVFVWYVTTIADYSKVYGPVSAVLILLIWTHFSALILIWGAELASEFSKLRKTRQDRKSSPEFAVSG
jgi:membrane protein